MQENGIAKSKVVSFTSDGATVMTGCRTGLAERVKADCPYALAFHCATHKLQLACADLFENDPDLVAFDELLSRIYNYFGNSSQRKARYAELFEEYGAKALAVLQPHK